MRISDWSSDVCSSDLAHCPGIGNILSHWNGDGDGEGGRCAVLSRAVLRYSRKRRDRKSVVSGKSVSVRVDLGGRRIINKKNLTTSPTKQDIQLTPLLHLQLEKQYLELHD